MDESQNKEQKAVEETYYEEVVSELFKGILDTVDKISDQLKGSDHKNERYYVDNIKTNAENAKHSVGEKCNPEFFEYQVEFKLQCLKLELDRMLHLLRNETEPEKRKGTEWLLAAIAKRAEKVRTLVSAFSGPPEKRPREDVIEADEFRQLGVKESLLSSSIARATLAKSLDRLPLKTRLCFLCLAAFPENSVVKKRLLVYWWMAEGFVGDEQDGEEIFMNLVRRGYLIRADDDEQLTRVKSVRVHPWIRIMLVSLALEARMFEFYNRHRTSTADYDGFLFDPLGRLCLYEEADKDKEAEVINLKDMGMEDIRELRELLKWLNARIVCYDKKMKSMQGQNDLEDRMKKARLGYKLLVRESVKLVYNLDLENIRADFLLSRVKPWTGDKIFERFKERFHTLQTDYDSVRVSEEKKLLERNQRLLLRELEQLSRWLKLRLHDIDMLTKGKNLSDDSKFHDSESFPDYDLSRAYDEANNDVKFFCVVNVGRGGVLTKEDEKQWAKRLKWTRVLHLGRWQDTSPAPHIVAQDPQLLNRILGDSSWSRHLKYLSLRGISNITELPSTISGCINLETLDLKECHDLKSLPEEIESLSNSLTHLNISECNHLKSPKALIKTFKNLETLKGLVVEQKEDEKFLSDPGQSEISQKLRKLSILLQPKNTALDQKIDLTWFGNLEVLTITWKTSDKKFGRGIEIPRTGLKKLDLRSYPGEGWPNWLRYHSKLETLCIKQANDIRRVHEDVKMPDLKVLCFKYLNLGTEYTKDTLKTNFFPKLEHYYADACMKINTTCGTIQ